MSSGPIEPGKGQQAHRREPSREVSREASREASREVSREVSRDPAHTVDAMPTSDPGLFSSGGGSAPIPGGGGATHILSGTPFDSAAIDMGRAAIKEHPEQVGPYRIVSVVSAGGMGVVYKAERSQPVKQIVALKMILLGMDTREVVARFETERQALALMDHPNIAKVFDGGATESGRPYFVMEYVAGERITDYCDKHLLSTRERLDLFAQACDAIQHAHVKGIIHRDIKPSNVLVSVPEGSTKPIVKVIDFGVAKATGANAATVQKAFFTERGQLIGTPEYMSPEQAEMSTLDVDTRTDIYSLGVLLYELLTGSLPFDARTLRSRGFEEIRRIIREEDPPAPSTRLSKLGSTGTDVAKRRQTQIPTLAAELRRELEWIPLMAMRKDRTRRYQTATDLARDVRNYLGGEPLIAAPESSIYRVKKFTRKHRAGVTLAVAVTTALVLGIIGTTWQMVRARRAERLATEQRDAARRNKDVAISAVNSLLDTGGAQLVDLPGMQPIRDKLLRSAIGQLQNLVPDPEENASSRATMYYVLAGATADLGKLDDAIKSASEALRLQKSKSDDEAAAKTQALLAVLYTNAGRLAEARTTSESVIRFRRQSASAPTAPDAAKRLLAGALTTRGMIDFANRQPAQAMPWFREAAGIFAELAGRAPGDDGAESDWAKATYNLASAASLAQNYAGAVAGYEEARQAFVKLLGTQPTSLDLQSMVARVTNDLGVAHFSLGHAGDAADAFAKAVADRRKLADENLQKPTYQLDLADSLGWLSQAQRQTGNVTGADQSVADAVRVVEAARPKLSGENQREALAEVCATLSFLQLGTGRTGEAIAVAVTGLNEQRHNYRCRLNLAHARLVNGELDAAQGLYRELVREKPQVAAAEIREDLATLRALGRANPSFERVEAMLAAATRPAGR